MPAGAVCTYAVDIGQLREHQCGERHRLSGRGAGSVADQERGKRCDPCQCGGDRESLSADVEQSLAAWSRWGVHHVLLGGIQSERDGGQSVGQEVDGEDLWHRQRCGGSGRDREREREHLARVSGEQELHEPDDVRVDRASLADCGNDRREVVVGNHDVGGVHRGVRGAVAHRDADIGSGQCRRVVDPVAGHRNHVPAPLQRSNDPQLLRRRDPREHVDVNDSSPPARHR